MPPTCCVLAEVVALVVSSEMPVIIQRQLINSSEALREDFAECH